MSENGAGIHIDVDQSEPWRSYWSLRAGLRRLEALYERHPALRRVRIDVSAHPFSVGTG